jgi:hypothetical protein
MGAQMHATNLPEYPRTRMAVFPEQDQEHRDSMCRAYSWEGSKNADLPSGFAEQTRGGRVDLAFQSEPISEVNAGHVLRAMTDFGCWQLQATRLQRRQLPSHPTPCGAPRIGLVRHGEGTRATETASPPTSMQHAVIGRNRRGNPP